MLGAEPGASRKAASECSYVLSHLSTPEALIDLFSAVLCMEHAHCAVPVGQELCPGLCLLASPWRTLASCLLLSYSPSPGRGVLCYHFYLLLCVHDVCVWGGLIAMVHVWQAGDNFVSQFCPSTFTGFWGSI